MHADFRSSTLFGICTISIPYDIIVHERVYACFAPLLFIVQLNHRISCKAGFSYHWEGPQGGQFNKIFALSKSEAFPSSYFFCIHSENGRFRRSNLTSNEHVLIVPVIYSQASLCNFHYKRHCRIQSGYFGPSYRTIRQFRSYYHKLRHTMRAIVAFCNASSICVFQRNLLYV